MQQKGLDLLLGAFERLRHARPDLQLVSWAPISVVMKGRCEQMAAQLGVADRVLFTGILSHQLKLAAFVDAELFVLPSYAENFGTVIIEALMCGLPAVISDGVNTHRELESAGIATVVRRSVDSVAGRRRVGARRRLSARRALPRQALRS